MTTPTSEIPRRFWTVGTCLDVWEDQANIRFEEAQKKQGVIARVEAEAARQTILFIANARVLLTAHLLKTPRKLPPTEFGVIREIQTCAQESKSLAIMNFIDPARMSKWIALLSFPAHVPRVTDFSCRCFVPTGQSVSINFRGFFPNPNKSVYQPYLKIDGLKVKPFAESHQNLDFRFKPWNSEAKQVTYKVAKLKVPYETGYVRYCIEKATYRVLVCALPLSPVRVKVLYTPSKEISNQKNMNDLLSAKLEAGDAEHPWVNKKLSIRPSQGEYILPWTARCALINYRAYPWYSRPRITHIDSQSINVEIGLATKNQSNVVEFHVFYSTASIDVTVCSERIVELAWNTPVNITPNPGQTIFKYMVDTFDGSHYEFGEMIMHPYLQTYTEGGHHFLTCLSTPKGGEDV